MAGASLALPSPLARARAGANLSDTPDHGRGPLPGRGPSDVVARIVAEHMGKLLGQTMVIENVGGAGGTIGSARASRPPRPTATRCWPAAWARMSRPRC